MIRSSLHIWVPAFVVVTLGAGALALGCGPLQCSFQSQCQGNTLQTCHVVTGLVDQHLTTFDCTSIGGVCQTIDPTHAQCAESQASGAEPCDSTFVDYCSGPYLVLCDFSTGTGEVAEEDCSFDQNGNPGQCVDLGGGNASCQLQ